MEDDENSCIRCFLHLHEWYYERRRPFLDSHGYICLSSKKRECLRCGLRQAWIQEFNKYDFGFWMDINN